MAGVTDYPFRQIARKFGHVIVCSEMIASRAVLEALKNNKVRRRLHFFDATREAPPVSLQLVGYDPYIMAEAAKFNEQLGASIIDINMGCPVKKVVNTEAGAALMKNELLAGKIIEAVAKAVSAPVTVKMRLGWDSKSINASTLAKIAESAGAQGVIVHGRTRAQFYEGKADWLEIRRVKESVSIPVIGNGDILSAADAKERLEASGVNTVMIGRGALGRPWICGEVQRRLDCDATVVSTYNGVVLQHLRLMIEEYGKERGVLMARKHLSWYSREMPGAAHFRNTVNSLRDYDELLRVTEEFFGLHGV
jgi:tRNA-dihydrouridine synthase B